MTNSADPDQLASSEANWSGSTLFVKTTCVQQEKFKPNNRFWSYSGTTQNQEQMVHALNFKETYVLDIC